MALPALLREVRLAVYERFRTTAQAPSLTELASSFRVSREEMTRTLRALADAHALVLEHDGTSIWMAHPFSARPTNYGVEADGRLFYANCAWDALAIPSFLGRAAQSTAPCADCGEPIAWRVTEEGTLEGDTAVVHFLVPARRFWEDIGFT